METPHAQIRSNVLIVKGTAPPTQKLPDFSQGERHPKLRVVRKGIDTASPKFECPPF
jgi:hypothetical protein